jgi:hypothetical protein
MQHRIEIYEKSLLGIKRFASTLADSALKRNATGPLWLRSRSAGGEGRMRYKNRNDSTAVRQTASESPATTRHVLQRVWQERNWTVAILFAGLLIGSWAMVIANVANPIVDTTN